MAGSRNLLGRALHSPILEKYSTAAPQKAVAGDPWLPAKIAQHSALCQCAHPLPRCQSASRWAFDQDDIPVPTVNGARTLVWYHIGVSRPLTKLQEGPETILRFCQIENMCQIASASGGKQSRDDGVNNIVAATRTGADSSADGTHAQDISELPQISALAAYAGAKLACESAVGIRSNGICKSDGFIQRPTETLIYLISATTSVLPRNDATAQSADRDRANRIDPSYVFFLRWIPFPQSAWTPDTRWLLPNISLLDGDTANRCYYHTSYYCWPISTS